MRDASTATMMLMLLGSLLLWAAATDIRSRIISNRMNLAIALLAVPWWLAAGLSAQDILLQIGAAAVVLVVFGCCFALGMMGGGDVKLLTALALWLPLGAMLSMLVWMALAGGLLTLGMVIAHRLRNAPNRPEIPYGVAIVASALVIVANDILTTPTA
jgi:prepilin peptidase CpaA